MGHSCSGKVQAMRIVHMWQSHHQALPHPILPAKAKQLLAYFIQITKPGPGLGVPPTPTLSLFLTPSGPTLQGPTIKMSYVFKRSLLREPPVSLRKTHYLEEGAQPTVKKLQTLPSQTSRSKYARISDLCPPLHFKAGILDVLWGISRGPRNTQALQIC